MKKSKAFTLIELIAVLVILAILALIVTPLVMNIIKKARISADKRSIDAYGRSIELGIATYLMDNGRFPTSISDLNIEYSGDEVVCSTTDLNSDSTIYLTGCTVAGRTVDYEYRTQRRTSQTTSQVPTYDAYEIGDEVTYKGVEFFVIKNSDVNEEDLVLLAKFPLLTGDVNTYGGVGTNDNHVNMHINSEMSDIEAIETAYDSHGYGGMQYYSSQTCVWEGDQSGCTSNYLQSEVKYVVDNWAQAKFGSNGFKKARLLSANDFINFNYEINEYGLPGEVYDDNDQLISIEYDWIKAMTLDYVTYDSYWGTTSQGMFIVSEDGYFEGDEVTRPVPKVRPVVEISKADLSS